MSAQAPGAALSNNEYPPGGRHLPSTIDAPMQSNILLESETRALLSELDIALPEQLAFDRHNADAALAEVCSTFRGDRVVLKISSRTVLHKTEIGGVAIVDKRRQPLLEAVDRMAAMTGIESFIACEFIEHDLSPGSELLLGIRYTADFGPVVTLGIGGVATELFARSIVPGREIAVFSPVLRGRGVIARGIEGKLVAKLVIHGIRNQPPRMSARDLYSLVERWLAFAAARVPRDVTELEINPLVPTPRGLFALDAVVRLGSGAAAAHPAVERPIQKIRCILEPQSVGVVGVSKSHNPGRVIVANLINAGFERSRIFIVKPGETEIDGCRCVPDISSIPGRVDLLVLTIAAEQIPAAIDEVIAGEKAQSIIVIPGGMGEHAGSESLEQSVRSSLAASRSTAWRGPVVNGGNCLGVHSIPGRCNTIFLPEAKLESGRTFEEPLAVVSQSGALAVALATKLAPIAARYLVSIGNQVDLTVGDYMEYLSRDSSIDVAAFYVEGFQPLDGRRWIRAAADARNAGKIVILYRAGRTTAGALATATHTAAIAGDAVVSRELAIAAGALVAETLEEFEDLIRAATLLRGRAAQGMRLAAMSNAGFESVAFADNLGPFTLAAIGAATHERIAALLRGAKLDRIVTVGNPLDVNPMLSDEPFAAAAAELIGDGNADAAIVGVVPLTGALRTLEAEIGAEESIVNRLVEIWRSTTKPWACVVDSGPRYDAMRRALAEAGIPTFPSSDRAIRALGKWAAQQVASSG